MKKIFCALLLMVLPKAAMALDPEWDFDYGSEFVVEHLRFAPYIDDEENCSICYAECTGFVEEDDYNSITSLTVPQTVDFEGQTFTVVSIGEYAFYGSRLESVTVPSSVTCIRDAAFLGKFLNTAYIQSMQLTMGMAVFSASLLEMHVSATVPPVISDLFILDLDTYTYTSDVIVYVPQGSLNAYLAVMRWANFNLYEEGSPLPEKVELNVQAQKGGTLRQLVSEQNQNWRSAVSLTVSGPMNNDDIKFVRDSLPKLKTLDMTDAVVRALPASAFERAKYKTVRLPLTLESIGTDAFNGCSLIDTLILPEGLQTIGESAFLLCNGLKLLKLPSTLLSIGSSAIVAYNMTEEGSDAVITIECDAFFPPAAKNNSIYSYGYDFIVKVPAISAEYYLAATPWKDLQLETENILPESIVLQEQRKLSTDNMPQGYSPKLLFDAVSYSNGPYGSLTLEGSSAFNASQLCLYTNLFYDRNYTDLAAATLYLDVPFTAGEVMHDMTAMAGEWYFISFPFDVRISEVKTSSDVKNWVVRSYSSVNRANGISNQWVDVPAGGTLKANQGYVWYFATKDKDHDYGFGDKILFSVKAPAETTMFSTQDVTVPLQTYAATYAHNCNWNLVGNPFPTYFDISCLDQTMPVTVWDGYWKTYKTYSPVDDEYILRPNQPMFLQKPDGVESLTFKAAGRQISNKKQTSGNGDNNNSGNSDNNESYDSDDSYEDSGDIFIVSGAPQRGSSRCIYNFSVTSADFMDETRVVLNEDASVLYDMRNDALKFFSPNDAVPQLYTMIDGAPCSINEGAFIDGRVVLGIKAEGTKPCTISMTRGQGSVFLEDKVTGKVVDLAEESYTFTPTAGRSDSRFTLNFGNVTKVEGIQSDDDSSTFDLSGRQMENPAASDMYIRNGKKFINK